MKVRSIRTRARVMITVRGKGWGPVTYTRKRADWRANAEDLKGVAGYTQYQESARLSKQRQAHYDALYDEAYIRACELDSPNSPDFDALFSRIHEELCDA